MKQSRFLALVLSLSLGSLVCAADDPAQLTPSRAFDTAEVRYRDGDLLAAEKLYQRARASTDPAHRRLSIDRLLIIYMRLGRADQTIELGLDYRRWLREQKEVARLRELALQLGEAWLTLGHYTEAKKNLLEALEGEPESALLPPAQLSTWSLLGSIADIHRDRPQALKCWRQVETLALEALDKRRDKLSGRDHVETVWKLADAYRELERPGEAIERLKPLLELHKDDLRGQRDTLFRLAGHHATLKKFAEAEKALRAALVAHRQADGDNLLTEGDLLQALGDTLEKRSQLEAADQTREEAAGKYLAVLKENDRKTARAALAFWRLETLYQKASQYRHAVELTEIQAAHWTRDTLVHGRLIAEQGSLKVLIGAYKQAYEPLKDAVGRLEQERPLNLIELPRVLNNLATVEQALNNLEEAQKHAERALQLYRDHRLPDDLTRAESHNVLGTTLALRGQYYQAIDSFRAGIACCEKLGTIADPQHSHLLLHVALLHKAQGDLALALPTCQKAFALYATFAHPEAFGHACFHAALATMEIAQGKYKQAATHSERILELCRKYDISSGILIVTARHAQGLDRLDRRELSEARNQWQQTLELQEKEGELLLRPRTLSFLGLCAEMEGKDAEAEKLYRQALDIQNKNPRALPGVHFITLWRLANILDRQGKRAEGRELLARALDVAEAARVRLYGDAKQRAQFFAQFAMGFEELIDRCVRDGKPEEALQHALRGRSRTYLDQMQLCGIDPRETLEGDSGVKLRQREAELTRQMAALRARAQFLAQPSAKEIAQLTRELEEAQQQYAEVWREILNATPLYRSLALDAGASKGLQAIRARALPRGTVMLWYWIGHDRSYAFIVQAEGAIEVFPLLVRADLAETVARLAKSNDLAGQVPTRDIIYTRKPKPTQEPTPGKQPESVWLNAGLTRQLVEVYRQNLKPDFTPTRDIVLTKRKTARKETTGVSVIGEAIVPAALRKRLQATGAEQIIVVPDAALHKLPLEALVVQSGAKTRYVLDELPPLLYAPSAAALAYWVERPASKGSATSSLLTVGNLAYPQPQEAAALDPDLEIEAVLGLKGQLPLLPHSGAESKRIATLFAADKRVSLDGKNATEKAVVTALPGKRYVHLAVHGFADERLGNLFGALALMPPEKGSTPDDDGFLSVHEIYRLPLHECELAVLSACQTNVGPQQPLEAGITLAGAFLSAGAKRVVASHWSVSDRSAAELMGTFFEAITTATSKGEVLSHAQALRKAQRKLRDSPEWSAPYHWAPFVIVGPP